MDIKELLNLAEKNKDLRLKDCYFHGEKIATVLKSLKKHTVSITFNYNFLNPNNLPDLVIDFTGPSIGQFCFHGQLYSRTEQKMNLKEAKINEKIRAQEAKKESKRLKTTLKEYTGPLFWSPGLRGYIYTKTDSNDLIILTFPGKYESKTVDESGFFELNCEQVNLKDLKKVV